MGARSTRVTMYGAPRRPTKCTSKLKPTERGLTVPKVKFVKPHQKKGLAFVAKQGNRPCPEGRENDSPFYEVGHVLECGEVTAKKYIAKGVAERVIERPAPAPKPAKPEDDKK